MERNWKHRRDKHGTERMETGKKQKWKVKGMGTRIK